MPYIGTTPTKVVSRQSANVYRYTATAGQSVFTGADLDNNVLACNPADMIVHMNGLRLESTDYTATSTSVTLTTAATAGDEVTVTSFVTFEVADTYTKTAADDRYVNTTGDTMTGALVVSAAETNDIIKLERTGSYAGSGYIYANQNQTFGVKTGAGQYQLMVDSAGRVTMPYQPAFAAYPSTAVTISAAGNYDTVQADAVKTNVGSCYNTSAYLFTAPVSGSYAFFGTIRFNNNSGTYVRAAFAINGTVDLQYASDINQDTGNYTTCSIAGVIQLSANDTVSLVGRSQTDASVDISVNGTSFSGHLIG